MIVLVKEVTETMEEYLECIYRLQQRDGVARTSEMVKMLNVVPGTITNTIKRLVKEGLVIHEPYKGVRLTKAARARIEIINTTNIDGYLDLSEISVIPQRMKSKRSIGYTIIAIRTKDKVFYQIVKGKSNTVKSDRVLSFLLEVQKRGIELKNIVIDSQFPTLPYNIGKIQNWNCAKSLIEKDFGIKTKIYQNLNYIKKILGLTKKDLLTTHKDIVLRLNKTILQRHEWILIPQTPKIEQTQQIENNIMIQQTSNKN